METETEVTRKVFAPAVDRRKLDESELRAAFAGVHEDTPIWQAIQQLLLEEVEAAILLTGANAVGEHGQLAAAAGAMEALANFYGKLKRAHRIAHGVEPRE